MRAEKRKPEIAERLFNLLNSRQIGELAKALGTSKTFIKKRSYKRVLEHIDTQLFYLNGEVFQTDEDSRMLNIMCKYKKMIEIFFME